MMKILYIASDNYRGSGAFLSMVNLAKLMEKNYNVDVLAILPEKGNGEELLKDYSIPFKIYQIFELVYQNRQTEASDN